MTSLTDFLRSALLHTGADGEGDSYDEIIRRAQAAFPKCATSRASLRVLASKMRDEGHMVPTRRRCSRGPRMAGIDQGTWDFLFQEAEARGMSADELLTRMLGRL